MSESRVRDDDDKDDKDEGGFMDACAPGVRVRSDVLCKDICWRLSRLVFFRLILHEHLVCEAQRIAVTQRNDI